MSTGVAKQKTAEPRYRFWNESIYRGQVKVAGLVDEYFTFRFALFFSFTTGILFSFIGSTCHGKIGYNSPVYYMLSFLILITCFYMYITIQLTIGRIIRFFGTAICSHYLAYQGYGWYSINYITPTTGYICTPYLSTYGYEGHLFMWPPMVIILFFCIFSWNKNQGTFVLNHDPDVSGK